MPAGNLQTDGGILGKALGDDPVLGKVPPQLRQILQGPAHAAAVEKGKGFIEKDELVVPHQPRHQFLGQTQAQGQHNLALGAVGDLVQVQQIALIAGIDPHLQPLVHLQKLVAALGELRQGMTHHVAQPFAETPREVAGRPVQEFLGQKPGGDPVLIQGDALADFGQLPRQVAVAQALGPHPLQPRLHGGLQGAEPGEIALDPDGLVLQGAGHLGGRGLQQENPLPQAGAALHVGPVDEDPGRFVRPPLTQGTDQARRQGLQGVQPIQLLGQAPCPGPTAAHPQGQHGQPQPEQQ